MTDKEVLIKLENVNQLLSNNQSLQVGDLTLRADDATELKVIGWTNFIRFDNLTKKQSLKELKEIKDLFQLMLNASKALSDFSENKTIKYFLHCDDYGKCGVAICSEEDGQISWKAKLPDG